MAEQLSAWLDGELSAAELELLTARLNQPSPDADESRRMLARYGLIGAALQRGNPAALVPVLDLASRVRASIEKVPGQDPVASHASPARKPRRTSLWYSAGTAAALLAAAVALPLFLDERSPPAPVVAASGENPVRADGPAPVPLSDARLTSYLAFHGEYTGALSNRVADSHVVSSRPIMAASTPIRTDALQTAPGGSPP